MAEYLTDDDMEGFLQAMHIIELKLDKDADTALQQIDLWTFRPLRTADCKGGHQLRQREKDIGRVEDSSVNLSMVYSEQNKLVRHFFGTLLG